MLDAIFSRRGIPEILKSYNGPPFNSADFESYANHCGFIIHRKITSYLPHENGEAEHFMHSLCSSCNYREEQLEASDEPLSPKVQGNSHTTTNTFPSESLNNRKIKTMLPEMYSTSKHEQKMMVNMMLRRKC